MGLLKKITRSIKKFVSNPGRAVSAVATGGASEILRAGDKALVPSIPGVPDPGDIPDQDAAAAAIEEENMRLRRARNRALTGRIGRKSSTMESWRCACGRPCF